MWLPTIGAQQRFDPASAAAVRVRRVSALRSKDRHRRPPGGREDLPHRANPHATIAEMTHEDAPVPSRARRVPLLAGILPIRRRALGSDALAGVTLAALAVPEVLGYAKIAGMPPVTGLYTMLAPVVLFAVFGASRHLVVGADSATAAILAAGLASLAAPASAAYVRLAGTAALLVGAMLLLARLIRLGFLANFLSRTVLVGFLTGVGIQVAAGQLPDMLGVPAGGNETVPKLVNLVRALGHTDAATALVSAAVVVVVVGTRLVAKKVPGGLIAVIGAIVVSELVDLSAHGVAVLGSVPQGIPHVALPTFDLHDMSTLLGTAVSMFVVILAQSSATSRAYATRYEETVDEDADLVGLGTANVAAAFTGTFVVNGSPTKTQIVDGAGGRSQIAPLAAGVIAVVVLVFLTGPLGALPLAALATVVFLIGVDLIDIAGMRRIFQVRRAEFVVALLTAAAVVFTGVEQGVVLAIIVSVVDHLRHSYRPHSGVLVKSPAGHWQPEAVTPGRRTTEGMIVYRFGSSLYFANAMRLGTDVTTLLTGGRTVTWFCLDCAAVGDVDYTSAGVLSTVAKRLGTHGTRLVLSGVLPEVRAQLDRYGLTRTIGVDSYFDTAGAALDAFDNRKA
ncbi:SulP family inorganic anion transporter [Amycolatopsis sp. DSM 110486]|uniref:SulP family inorganic anion transporter n=1 Tax=Amycolatopsis sp. DSM 110486 TaxID=2865832 RepID=UPI001C6A5F16|nr:SulP family inorganic anion transporter [Amycolatopsis sp. DSM 110486]QYN18769.1 SulP family inorganic anion transporter [Amycolatopsis sp. DSM 110486]